MRHALCRYMPRWFTLFFRRHLVRLLAISIYSFLRCVHITQRPSKLPLILDLVIIMERPLRHPLTQADGRFGTGGCRWLESAVLVVGGEDVAAFGVVAGDF